MAKVVFFMALRIEVEIRYSTIFEEICICIELSFSNSTHFSPRVRTVVVGRVNRVVKIVEHVNRVVMHHQTAKKC